VTATLGIVANGFADGPAQALRDYLVGRGDDVVVVLHPLTPEQGRTHRVERYSGGAHAGNRALRTPFRPPLSFATDGLVPFPLPRVDAWFGFNPLACARALVERRVGRAATVVLWSVDFAPDRFGAGTLLTRAYDRLDRLCCTRADARVELSAAARDARNRRHRLPPEGTPTHVVPMGAWLDRVPTVPPDGVHARRVAYLGHLVRRQGVDVLLDAMAIARDGGEPLGLDVIGTGPEEGALRRRAASLSLGERVRFHGFVGDHREVERRLAAASLAVAPYRPGEETFSRYADPGKLKAYLAAGLPIVLTDVPPNASELVREAGAQVVPFAAEAIASALLDGLASPERWQERRRAALAYVRRFDWPALLAPLLGGLDLD
jgi:glycosyltransferase involved in cell wall biosynthesis